MQAFDRQISIPGWRQNVVENSRILVAGRGWVGCFAVWGLSGLGVGEVLWTGEDMPPTAPFVRFLANDHAPGLGVGIRQYPLEPQRPEELSWVIEVRPPKAVLAVARPQLDAYVRETRRLRIPLLIAGAHRRGGFIEGSPTHPVHTHDAAALPSMLLAAALGVDESLRLIGGLHREGVRELGGFELPCPDPACGAAAVIGVGAVGVYVAVLLAAMGVPILLIDSDSVEPTNLNRQGLFTSTDAKLGEPKAFAAAHRLAGLFPNARVTAAVGRVGCSSLPMLKDSQARVLISCVDNAVSRLAISELGKKLGVPVVQAGTDVFAADCHVQSPGGPTLDEQTSGAISAAAKEESEAGGGACSASPSYVVPGMVAGAFAASRALSAMAGAAALHSLHWRSGFLPVERRRASDGSRSQTR